MKTLIHLQPDQIKWLHSAANQEGVSVDDITRKAIAYYQALQEKQSQLLRLSANSKACDQVKTKQSTKQLLMSMAERAEQENWSAPADVAENLDSYLY
jgi:hypothetical protein